MKNKIIQNFVIIFLIIAVFICYFYAQHETAKKEVANQVAKKQALLSKVGAYQIKIFGDTMREELLNAANSYPLQEYMAAKKQNDSELTAARKNSFIQFLIAMLKPHRSMIQINFMDLMESNDIRVVRMDGKVASTKSLRKKNDYWRFTYYKMTMEPDQILQSIVTLGNEVEEDSLLDMEALRLGTPVFYENQKVGMIILDINMYAIYDFIGNLSDHAWLFNEYGYLIYCSAGLPQKEHEILINRIEQNHNEISTLPLGNYHTNEGDSIVGFSKMQFINQKWMVVAETSSDEISEIMSANERNRDILFATVILLSILLYLNLHKISIDNQMVKSKEVLADKLQFLNKQLEQKTVSQEKANHSLQEMDAKKSDFLNMVAHDLRTPLTAINSYADLLFKYADNSDKKQIEEYSSIIKKEASKLRNMVNVYLDVTKIEKKLVLYMQDRVSIEKIIGFHENLFKNQADMYQIKISSEIEKDLSPVIFDKERLDEIFANLIDDTIKYTAAGGSIHIEASSIIKQTNDTELPFVKISIAGLNRGISENKKTKIFEKDCIADNGSANEKQSVGMRLDATKSIIEQNGGVYIESKEGSVTVYTFILKSTTEAMNGSNDEVIAWSDKFSVNNTALDVQHKRLINYINNLHQAKVANSAHHIIDILLDELVEHTKTHFELEEEIMRRANFPYYAEHKLMHNSICFQINYIKKKYSSGDLEVTTELTNLMNNWLTEHIFIEDKKYVPYLHDDLSQIELQKESY